MRGNVNSRIEWYKAVFQAQSRIQSNSKLKGQILIGSVDNFFLLEVCYRHLCYKFKVRLFKVCDKSIILFGFCFVWKVR